MPAVTSVRPCPACTFHNLPSATHCDVCDEPLAAPAPALVTPAKSMDGVKVKTEGVTVKPESADGAAPVKVEVKDEDEEEPALVCVPRKAPKAKIGLPRPLLKWEAWGARCRFRPLETVGTASNMHVMA